jgi:hypothetical protein
MDFGTRMGASRGPSHGYAKPTTPSSDTSKVHIRKPGGNGKVPAIDPLSGIAVSV